MRITLLLVTVMALWGSAFASSKLAVAAAPHEVAGFLRFGIGTLVLLALGPPRLAPADAARAGGLGLLGVFGYNALFFLALSLAPAADGSVIVPMTAPLVVVVVSALLGRERLARKRIAGLIGAAAGGALFFAGIAGSGPHRLLGDAVFVAAAVCWAGYTFFGAPVLARLPAPAVTAYATAVGTVALGLLAAPALETVAWSDLSAEFWWSTVYSGVLPTALAYSLYYRAVRAVGAATAASAMFLVPVFGLACAWALLGETIAPLQAAGAALLVTGAWFATRRRAALPAGQPKSRPSPR
ncbi:DMT family transporter [Nocardia sp. NPDC003482]